MAACGGADIDVESLCLAHGLQPEKSKLDAIITEAHILDIANFITEWRLLGAGLRLSDAQIEEVEALQGGGDKFKRVKMLKKWRESQYRSATYRRLVEALLRLKKEDQATEVCALLGLQARGTCTKCGG